MKKTYQPISVHEAFKLLAEAACPLEGYAFRDWPEDPWKYGLLTGVDLVGPYKFTTPNCGYRECARCILEASPVAKGHNPDSLTEEQVGVSEGWRLLTEHEKRGQHGGREVQIHRGCNIWESPDKGYADGWYLNRRQVFRTKSPVGFFLSKPKKLVPWTLETAPKGTVLLRQKGVTSIIEAVVTWTPDYLRAGSYHTINWHSLSEAFEHSLDGGKTWKICGTEV